MLFFNHISGKSLLQCTQVYILKSVKKIFSQAKVSYRHEQPKRGGAVCSVGRQRTFWSGARCVRGVRMVPFPQVRVRGGNTPGPQATDCPLTLGPISMRKLCWPDSKSRQKPGCLVSATNHLTGREGGLACWAFACVRWLRSGFEYL